MSSLSLAAILLSLASVFGFVNYRFLRLPTAIGLMVVSLVASLCVLALDRMLPQLDLRGWSEQILGTRRLPETLLAGALSLLLFAGALHVSMAHLWSRKYTVLLLATVGVALATLLFGLGIRQVFRLVGHNVPLAWCIVLGAILAPTDPVAVAGLLARVGLPERLQAVMAGESLFNDGVGVVVFNLALGIALGGGEALHAGRIALEFAFEALGGLALGLATGWIAYRLMYRIDEYPLEIMISLALATGTYSICCTGARRWAAAAVLTWGGLRGGISVALALTLPETDWRGAILTVCYGVVVFTIVVQGLTMEWLIRRVFPREAGV